MDTKEGQPFKNQEIANVSERKNQQKMKNAGHQFLTSDKLVSTMTTNLKPNQKKVERENDTKTIGDDFKLVIMMFVDHMDFPILGKRTDRQWEE